MSRTRRNARSNPASGAKLAQGEALRRALLERLARALAVARGLQDGTVPGGCWTCCWVSYSWRTTRGNEEEWLHRLCSDNCPHWHHQNEVFLATG